MTALPLDLILHTVVPYVETDATLVALARCNKWLRRSIPIHEFPTCSRCVGHRFRVGPARMCWTPGCMARSPIHPIVYYKTVDGEPLCSLGCVHAMAHV